LRDESGVVESRREIIARAAEERMRRERERERGGAQGGDR
jgi:hypothetical protein